MSHRTLAADGLVVGYDRGPRVLDGASIRLAAGRRLAVLGANGSGKTTLLRCLAGALRSQAGAVTVDGHRLEHSRAGLRAHRQEVQLVLQDPDDQLFSASVAQDVSFGPVNLGLDDDTVRARVAEALRLLAVEHLADRPTHQLSFGERKRVAIAGAVAMRPCVLLLDEPTAGLDPAGRHEMLDLVRRLATFGISVIMATHLLDDVQTTCDQVVMIDAGRLVAAGRTQALLETTGTVRVDVSGRGQELVDALRTSGAVADPALLPDGSVEVAVTDDADLDAIVAALDEAGLPLHGLLGRRSSLDDVFIDRSREQRA
jgi:cobalt/nickel transport system ATP-binding protein